MSQKGEKRREGCLKVGSRIGSPCPYQYLIMKTPLQTFLLKFRIANLLLSPIAWPNSVDLHQSEVAAMENRRYGIIKPVGMAG